MRSRRVPLDWRNDADSEVPARRLGQGAGSGGGGGQKVLFVLGHVFTTRDGGRGLFTTRGRVRWRVSSSSAGRAQEHEGQSAAHTAVRGAAEAADGFRGQDCPLYVATTLCSYERPDICSYALYCKLLRAPDARAGTERGYAATRPARADSVSGLCGRERALLFLHELRTHCRFHGTRSSICYGMPVLTWATAPVIRHGRC
eukprot:2241252-Rhodomonas_salina.5